MSSDPITWLDGGPTTPIPQIDLLEAFARRFLDPDDLGYSVSKYTRDQARVALGRAAVESNQFQRDQQVGVSPALRHQIQRSPRPHHQEPLMTTPTPNRDEMRDVIADADAAMDEGSKWPGMSYEQGVAEALRWVLGESKNPLAD